jgi:hypothetical protein
MTYDELKDLIYTYEEDPSLSEVHFGCDCGCGGDSWTIETWREYGEASDLAKEKLEKFGVTFD